MKGVAVLCVAFLVQVSVTRGDVFDDTADDASFTTDIANGLDDANAPAFTLRDSLYLVYQNDAERTHVLAMVLQLWRNALVPYQALSQKVTIDLISSKLVGGSVKNQMFVVFKLTGQSRLKIDFTAAKASFHATIGASHLGNVENAPDGADLGGSSENKEATEAPADTGITFEITDTITMTFSSTSERDSILQQLIAIWTATLSSYTAVNIEVKFVKQEVDSDASGAGSVQVYIVTYTISGQSTTEVDQEAAKKSFHEALVTAHITGIYFDITFTDTIKLTYSSEEERQTFLDQLLVIWKTTLVSYNVIHVTIEFENEESDTNAILALISTSSKTYTVTYKIVFMSSTPVDEDEAKGKFKRALDEAHFTGGPTSDAVDTTPAPSGSTFELTNLVITITFTTTEERDDYMNQILELWRVTLARYGVTNVVIKTTSTKVDATHPGGNTWIITYTISGESTTPVEEEVAKREFNTALIEKHFIFVIIITPGGDSEVTEAPTDDTSTEAPTDGDVDTTPEPSSTTFEITDLDITITFTTTDERDKYMNQILELWRVTLGRYGGKNVVIRIIRSEKDTTQPGGNTWKITYTISGESTTPINPAVVQSDFESVLIEKHYKFVITVTPVNDASDTSYPFMISDSIHFAYKTPQERDSFLYQLLAIWKTVLETYEVTNIKITFVHEKIDPSAKPNSYGKVYIVSFVIDGLSPKSVDQEEAKNRFKKALEDAPLPQVVLTTTTTELTGFVVTDKLSLRIAYTTNQERDSILTRLFSIYQRVVDELYHSDDINIIFDTTMPHVTPKGFTGTTTGFRYHVTFRTQTPIDADKVRSLIERYLGSARITGVVRFEIITSGDDDSGSDDDDSETTTAVAVPAGPSTFEIPNLFITITFTTTEERDKYMNQILELWRITLARYGVKNVLIRIIRSDKDTTQPGGNTWKLTYEITGESTTPVNQAVIKPEFETALTEKHFTFVIIITSVTEHTATSYPFLVSDSIRFAYKTPKERDSFLDQLLVFWKTVLKTYKATNAKITFVHEKVDPSAKPNSYGTVYIVSYMVDGLSPQSFDQDDAKIRFKKALEDAHLPQLVSTTTSTDLTGFVVTDLLSLRIAYSTNQERDSILTRLFAIYQRVLDELYQSDDINIIFKSTKSHSTPQGYTGTTTSFSYQVTFRTQTPIDADQLKALIVKYLGAANIKGVIRFEIITSGEDDTGSDDDEETTAGTSGSDGGSCSCSCAA